MNEEEIRDKLVTLTEDLWFPSESDEPFDVEIRKDLGGSIIDKIDHLSQNSVNARMIDWASFWHPLITPNDWNGPDEEAVRMRFVDLKAFFEKISSDYFVVKIGKVEVDVLIIGALSATDSILLKTLAIES